MQVYSSLNQRYYLESIVPACTDNPLSPQKKLDFQKKVHAQKSQVNSTQPHTGLRQVFCMTVLFLYGGKCQIDQLQGHFCPPGFTI